MASFVVEEFNTHVTKILLLLLDYAPTFSLSQIGSWLMGSGKGSSSRACPPSADIQLLTMIGMAFTTAWSTFKVAIVVV